jgi:hypothetical protein
MNWRQGTIIRTEEIAMAGFGRFKLTDAIPDQPVDDQELRSGTGLPGASPGAKARGRGKKKGKLARDQSKLAQSAGADAEPGTRDRMVDIGRGNQQAGRQRSSGK